MLALLAGAALPFAFAPFSWFFIAIISPAVLFLLWQDVSVKRGFLRGWLFGLGYFGVGISWVYVSFNDFSDMGWLAAGLLTVGFVMFLSLYIGLLGGLTARFFPAAHYSKFLLILPTAWVWIEWFRGWLFTGFPWLNLGYSQIDSPLRSLAPVLGVYGVSLAVALTAGLIAFVLQSRHWKLEETLLSLFLFGAIWGGSWSLSTLQWHAPSADPLKVALIQGNIPQEFKWQSQYQQETLERYLRLSQTQRDADLIIWPETAIPTFFHFKITQQLLEILMQERAIYHMDFLLGIPYKNEPDEYYNSVLSLSELSGFYHKNHLVPFGEYVPLLNWFGSIFDVLKVPMSSFSAGAYYQNNLFAADQSIGVSICYEAAFGERIRTALPKASLLVNVSNDAWFGDSIAPHQHLEIAQMRALETGRYLLRATNTGISAIINPSGQVTARTPQFTTQALTATVQPMQGITPYVRLGELPLILLLAAGFALGLAIHHPIQAQTRQAIF